MSSAGEEEARDVDVDMAVAEDPVTMDEDEVGEDGAAKDSGDEESKVVAYTIDYLHSVRDALGKGAQWPDYLDEAFKNSRGKWDPDRWHQGRKRGLTPPPPEDRAERDRRPTRGTMAGRGEEERPNSSLSADGRRGPKERLKADHQLQDGLVLSPQGRSFLTGCQVAASAGAASSGPPDPSGDQNGRDSRKDARGPRGGGPGGPGGEEAGSEEFSLRPQAAGTRVGSGRVLNRGDRDDYERRFEVRKPVDREERYSFNSRRGGREDEGPGGPGEQADQRRRGGDRSRERKVWLHDRAEEEPRYRQEEDRFGRRNMRGGMMGGRDMRGGMEDRRGGGRFGRREEAAPEWMSETVDQGDMMELRGFDDSPEKDRQRTTTKLTLQQQEDEVRNRHGRSKEMTLQQQEDEIRNRHSRGKEIKLRTAAEDNNSRTEQYVFGKKKEQPQQQPHHQQQQQPPPQQQAPPPDCGFNLDDILHMESIPGLANILADDSMDMVGLESSGAGASGAPDSEQQRQQGSRFIQLFKQRQQEEPSHLHVAPEDKNSRRSSIQDEVNLNNGSGSDGNQPQIRIPTPTDANAAFYFAPISPAAKTTSQPNRNAAAEQQQQANPLMDLLRGNIQGSGNSSKAAAAISRLRGNKDVKSVEELEADLKQKEEAWAEMRAKVDVQQQQQHAKRQHHMQQQHQHHNAAPTKMENSEELSVFQKFAAMIPKDDPANMATGFHTQLAAQPGAAQPGAAPVIGGPVSRPGTAVVSGGLIRPSPIPPTGNNVERDVLQTASPPSLQPQRRVPPPQQQTVPPPPPMALHGQHPDLLQLIHHHPMNYDILNRSEAVALQIAVANGHATAFSLLQQFAHGNLQTKQRETLLMVLKVQQNNARLPLRMTPELTQLLNVVGPQQQQQQQPPPPQHHGSVAAVHPQAHPQAHQHPVSPQRTSPMMPGNDAGSQLHAAPALMPQQQRLSPSGIFSQQQQQQMGGKNSLSVSPAPPGQQRIPSPQELVYHTQQIMQNALIKRKLEEQKENYRKRQEGQQTMPMLPNERSNSDLKAGTDSPLTFTPTVVMKKMAAERRDSDPRPQIPELRFSQDNQGASGFGSSSNNNIHLRFKEMKLDAGSRTSPISPQNNVPIPPPNPTLLIQQQQQAAQAAAAAALQQQQALQQIAARGGRIPHPQQDPIAALMQHGGGGGRDPHFHPGMHGLQQQQMSGSPANGALSQFFSPEVLAQAQSGNAPSMPPLPTQKALTLEEIERQAAAVRI